MNRTKRITRGERVTCEQIDLVLPRREIGDRIVADLRREHELVRSCTTRQDVGLCG